MLPHSTNANGLGEHANAFRLMPDISLASLACDIYAALTVAIILDGQLRRSTDIDIRLSGSDLGGPALEY